MTTIAEPSVWAFDGEQPARDLPADEAARVEEMTIQFDEPICSELPENAVDAIREVLRGFYEYTPYRRIAAIEREDPYCVAVRGETRQSSHKDDGWEPEIHPNDVASMQSTLVDFFGPLWRVRRIDDLAGGEECPGSAVVRRVVGRRFHYRDEDATDAEAVRAAAEEAVADG